MTFKKNMQSGKPVVVSGGDDSELFPVGYQYIMDGITWTVREAKRADNTEFRLVVGDEGTQEQLTVDTMKRDHDPNRSPGMVQPLGMKETPGAAKEEEVKEADAEEAAESDSEEEA